MRTSYCLLPTSALIIGEPCAWHRRLLSDHCAAELRAAFDVPGGYELRRAEFAAEPDSDGVLMVRAPTDD